MATFFGEVLPVYSRAIDDDEDEEVIEFSKPHKLRWSTDKASTEKGVTDSHNLVIAVGKASSGYTQAYMIDEDDVNLVGVIEEEGTTTDDEIHFNSTSFSEKACYILRCRSQPNNVFVQCNFDVKPDQYSAWTQLVINETKSLFPENDAMHVTVLCSSNVCDYKSAESSSELDVPFLRTLKTDTCKIDTSIDFLEQPNVISGLPAQVMTYCQVHSISAALYISYVENNRIIDSTCMQAFKALSKEQSLSSVKLRKNGDKRTLELAKQLDHFTMLYI